jgi:beta-lactam-binding protein with PASTA domain
VVGMSEAQAIATLKDAGFKVTTEEIGSFLPAGTVAEQDPAGGTSTLPGATIHLGISNGIAPVGIVPRVRGMTLEEAKAALAAANFVPAVVEVETTDKELIGVVIRQVPAADTKLEEGSTVTIYVGVEKSQGGGQGGGQGQGGGGSPSPTPTP